MAHLFTAVAEEHLNMDILVSLYIHAFVILCILKIHMKANNLCIRICVLELGAWNSYLKVYHIALIFIFPT